MTFTQTPFEFKLLWLAFCFIGFMAGFAYPLPVKAGEFVPISRQTMKMVMRQL